MGFGPAQGGPLGGLGASVELTEISALPTGSLIVGGSFELPVGDEGQILTPDPSVASGIAWTNQINGNITISGNLTVVGLIDGSGEEIAGSVTTFANLPSAAVNAGNIYIVEQPTGVFLLNRKRAGMYRSDGVTWTRLGDALTLFQDDRFELFHGLDSTKKVNFNLSGISTGTTRVVNFPDTDVNLQSVGTGDTPTFNGITLTDKVNGNCVVSGNNICPDSVLQGHIENGYVDLTSDQAVSGCKTFNCIRSSGDPTVGNDLVSQDYVTNNFELTITNNVSTSGSTETTLASISIPSNTVILLEVSIVGRRTDSADRAGYLRKAVIYRETDIAAIEGNVDTVLTRESNNQWDADITVSGTEAQIKVIGDAGEMVNWKSVHTTVEVS